MYDTTEAECPVIAAYKLQNKCGIKVEYNDWNKLQEMNVTVKKDSKYETDSGFAVLQLEVASDGDLNSFWRGYKMPDIRVCINVAHVIHPRSKVSKQNLVPELHINLLSLCILL